jgi:CheY-like chemotaxis protein
MKKKILYIEDEKDFIEIAEEALRQYDYQVIPALDGEEGFKKAKSEKPDLIYLDLFLPKVKGFDLCEKLKSDPETKAIPIIVISASGVEYLEDQCKNAGADGCIRKPYKVQELVMKTKMLLKDI